MGGYGGVGLYILNQLRSSMRYIDGHHVQEDRRGWTMMIIHTDGDHTMDDVLVWYAIKEEV